MFTNSDKFWSATGFGRHPLKEHRVNVETKSISLAKRFVVSVLELQDGPAQLVLGASMQLCRCRAVGEHAAA